MEVFKLKRGEHAPRDSDSICVELAADGRYQLIASALEGCSEAAESVAMIRGEPYATREAAEAAGVAWASDLCVTQLYIEDRDAADEPE